MVKVEYYLGEVRPVGSRILKRIRREAGDTLIEVTIALSILSMVLISSTVIATQAFRLGQTARERSTIAVASEGQLEAVRSFRDNNSWDHFLNGSTGAPAPSPGPSRDADALPHRGLLSATSNTGCHTSDACMHMVAGPNPTFVPNDGSMGGPVNTSYIELVAKPGPGASPQYVDVTVNYGFESLGSGNYTGHIMTRFTNLNGSPAATPPPVAPPCGTDVNDIILVMDTSSSMRDFMWDQGLTRAQEARKVAKSFVDKIQPTVAGNHIAVVGFNGSSPARTYIGLSPNGTAIKSAIDNLQYDYNTRYKEGLDEANNVFKSPQDRPGVNKVVVFLSDGLDDDTGYGNGGNRAPIFAAIDRFPQPLSLYTIGINMNSGDTQLLSDMARVPGFYSDAQFSSQLQQAYDGIAGMLVCK